MSVHPVDDIPCYYCSHPHIGKVEIWQWLANIGNISVYEITISGCVYSVEEFKEKELKFAKCRETEVRIYLETHAS